MRASIPLYEGDSLIHYIATARSLPVAQDAAPRRTWAAVIGGVRRFFLWLERGVERARYRELERYLASSADVCEVERRMREIEYRRGNSFDPYS